MYRDGQGDGRRAATLIWPAPLAADSLCLTSIAVAPTTALVIAGLVIVSFGMSPPMVLGAQLMVTSVPRRQAGPAAAIQDISASLGAAVGVMALGSLTMAVFGRGLDAGASAAVPAADLDAATESPGVAVAVADAIGGATGAGLLRAVEQAWSSGTVAAYAAALAVGVLTLVITVRGLRGVEIPSDDEPGTIRPQRPVAR